MEQSRVLITKFNTVQEYEKFLWCHEKFIIRGALSMDKAIEETRKAYKERCDAIIKLHAEKDELEKKLGSLLRADYDAQLKQLAKSVGFMAMMPEYRKLEIGDEGIYSCKFLTLTVFP